MTRTTHSFAAKNRAKKGLGPRRRSLNATTKAGIVLGLILVVIAIVAPIILTERAESMSDAVRENPSFAHLLGTDEFGRDLLARTLTATRLTLMLTVVATVISVGGGILIGTMVWVASPRLRRWVLNVNGVVVAFPALILALVVASILGPGAWTAVIAVGLAGIPGYTRLVANMAGSVAHQDYVTTARILGVPRVLLVPRHILPNIAEPLLITAANHFVVVLVELSGLSFIGLGVQSPEYDFGKLLKDSLQAIYVQPTQVLGPSIMLVLTGLAAMLIGDGLAASANPRVSSLLAKAKKRVRRPKSFMASEQHPVVVQDLRVLTQTGQPLVKGVSFTIGRGEVLGLVGESGSGKSLTAMSLAGLLPEALTAQADALDVVGEDVLGVPSRKNLARKIALVYQDPVSTFNPALKLQPQLSEVARTHLGMNRRDARRALLEQFEHVKILKPEMRLKQYPHELSGGMLQRAMIASALLTSAKLIIADEPTTALDVTVQAEVLKQFYRASRELDASLLFISHDLGVVESLCDRVMVMYQGEIVEELTAEQLRNRDVRHPYTKKLLSAALTLDAETGETDAQ